MHERALMRDVIARVVELARAEGATRISRVDVRLGALSHFTPDHFRGHFEDAARATIAQGAEIQATLDGDATAANAQGVVVESVELEYPAGHGAAD